MRGRRWRVTYQLADDRGLATTHMVVRATDERAALDIARDRRTAWEREREQYGLAVDRVGVFDGAWARPYTTGDGMDDGTSWASVALGTVGTAFMVVLGAGFYGARGTLVSAAAWVWVGLEIMCVVAFVGYLLYGAAALVYAGVTVRRERAEGRGEE